MAVVHEVLVVMRKARKTGFAGHPIHKLQYTYYVSVLRSHVWCLDKVGGFTRRVTMSKTGR